MERVEIRVDGMTCGGCVKSIQNALVNREGVSSATADLDSSMVAVEFDSGVIQQSAIEQAITDAGFSVAA
ncbi:MAG TPA: heavy-metal-associated domain-containing protein [Gammaproteobacteria bacterium]|nr:heavy-metal-associated domain-containing protein [Gammaproteobacteria bacterium]